MSDIQQTIASIVCGLKDSLRGIFKMYNLDQGLEDENEAKQEREQPMSILAQRRAERNRGREVQKKPVRSQKVMPRIVQCSAWNGGVFLASMVLFQYVVIPSLRYITHLLFGNVDTHNMVWALVGPLLAWMFSALWVLPLFVLSKIINSLWFQDIADAAYRKRRGRPQPLPSISKMIADILFSLLLQSLFLIQGMLANLLPIPGVGLVISQLHMCLLYSLYAFEYHWFNMGWPVNKRLAYIENHWPYFLGFGLPLAIITSMPTSFIYSGCFFSIIFPVFIISANEADNVGAPADFPLRLFAPVVKITNKVFQSSVNRTPQAAPPAPAAAATSSTKRVTLQDARR